jgi:hypothetical protein
MNPVSVYFDSNVIIDMCDGQRPALRAYILESAKNNSYIYPFSAAQVSEITKYPCTPRCIERLNFLGKISNNIYFVHSINEYGFRVETPNSVYETINGAVPALNTTSLFANFIPLDVLKNCREQLGLDPNRLNNLSGLDAVAEIDKALSSAIPSGIEAPRSIKELLASTQHITRKHFSSLWDSLGTTEANMTIGSELQGVFSLLETFGYWPDSKGVYQKGSRFSDVQHIFNAQHCYFLVTNDRGMKNRAEAAYEVLGVPTKVLFTVEYEAQCFEN